MGRMEILQAIRNNLISERAIEESAWSQLLEYWFEYGTSSNDRRWGQTWCVANQCATGKISVHTLWHLLEAIKCLWACHKCNVVNSWSQLLTNINVADQNNQSIGSMVIMAQLNQVRIWCARLSDFCHIAYELGERELLTERTMDTCCHNDGAGYLWYFNCSMFYWIIWHKKFDQPT